MSITSVKATINGAVHTLTYNETSGKWEATVTAPNKSSFTMDGHYYPVSVTATDNAGNSAEANASHATLGTSLRLVVKEKVKPTISITSPTSGAYTTNNKPPVKVQLRDDDSGVKIDTLAITIDSGEPINSTSPGVVCTPVSGGYDVTYTPSSVLGDGSHTVKVAVSDNDGNTADVKTVTFKVDTVPPTLSITAPAEGFVTNKTACAVTGKTNDSTSSPVTIKISLNGADQGAITVGSDGTFSKSVTLIEGVNTIIVTATDSAGKASSVTRTVTLNTKAPKFSKIELVPNPVDAGATYIIKVTLTED